MAKLKTITLGKNFKVGLPNYSNIDLHCEMTWEIGEDETPNIDAMWDTLNHELYVQSSGIDPTWLEKREFKNFFKVGVKLPKTEEVNS